MVFLYEGAFCKFPKSEEIIDYATGKDWIYLVKANGIEPEKYPRYVYDGRNAYVGFGSWNPVRVIWSI